MRSRLVSVATFIRSPTSALSSSVICGSSVTKTSASSTTRAARLYSASSGKVTVHGGHCRRTFSSYIMSKLLLKYGDGVGNNVEDNSSIFSLT